jgi:hypothetical protein
MPRVLDMAIQTAPPCNCNTRHRRVLDIYGGFPYTGPKGLTSEGCRI